MVRPPAKSMKHRQMRVCYLVVLSTCCVAFDSEPPADRADAILSAIENLESGNDAKCHSSASRFQDSSMEHPFPKEPDNPKSNCKSAW